MMWYLDIFTFTYSCFLLYIPLLQWFVPSGSYRYVTNYF